MNLWVTNLLSLTDLPLFCFAFYHTQFSWNKYKKKATMGIKVYVCFNSLPFAVYNNILKFPGAIPDVTEYVQM